jgi:hypothetical protein
LRNPIGSFVFGDEDNLKKRCEMFATLGLNHVYAATNTT